MLKIGNLKLKSNLILSPMSGVSDLPFRLINRKFGCELAFVEMVDIRSIGYKSKRTKKMLQTNTLDTPLGVQLVGADSDFIYRALDILNDYKFDVLDFNAACPAKKVTRKGKGAALLKSTEKLKELLGILIKNSKWPVTLKIRAGWDDSSVNAKDVALLAQDMGIKALFIHGRTKVQGYSGKVDYDVIRDVKKVLKIPVIASGDVLSSELAEKMLHCTGCDGLAIARGAFGNPWIFNEIKEFLKNGKALQRPAPSEIIDVMREHLNLCVDFHGERIGVIAFRKFFGYYAKGFQLVKVFREKAFRAKTKEEVLGVIEEFRLAHS